MYMRLFYLMLPNCTTLSCNLSWRHYLEILKCTDELEIGFYCDEVFAMAKLYGVETGALNRQVKRNQERFPEDFMFRLSAEEWEHLKCQNGISSWGGDRQRPYAFTENGIAMLSSVLRSDVAIAVNIRIMRAFTAMRQMRGESETGSGNLLESRKD